MNKLTRIWQKIKPKAKYVLGVLGIAAIVSQGAFAFTKLSATEPRFNFLQGDAELLRGANKTAGETVWKDPITGNAGDTFQGIVYYHNGMLDTTAENTKIKVTIPAHTTNKTAHLSASISADNAATVTDTIVDGEVVGLSGLTVNLDQDANIALVPDSVKWYPNQASNTGNVSTPLPFGQTGNEITNASGINIDGINGCWPFAGYVIFSFKTTPNAAPALNVEKTVRNVTSGETSFVEQTSASKNQVIEFKVDSANTGNTDLTNFMIKDSLPADLTFVSGSMKLAKNGGSLASISDADAALVFSSGLNAGTFQESKHDILTFEATAPASIATAKTVANTATVTSGSLTDSDIAKVNLIPDTAPCIVKNKDAKNLTTGQVATLNDVSGTAMKTTQARPGDVIEYTLTTKNTGNAASNGYVIKDGINDILEEANFVSASDAGHVVVTGLASDEAKQITYSPVDIAAGQTVVRTFTVKVMDPLPNNPMSGNDFDHKLFNLYGDKVLITISIPTPPVKLPILHIEKLVRNFTINELNFVDQNGAIAGDTLEYKVIFSNTGDGAADLVKFSDILPANTSYVVGSTVMSMNGGTEQVMPDGIISGGVNVDSIASGASGYIKFKVVTSAGIPAGTTLVNTATLTDNGNSISDTASTIIKAPIIKASLPRTGADTAAVAAIVAVLLASAGAFVYRRLV